MLMYQIFRMERRLFLAFVFFHQCWVKTFSAHKVSLQHSVKIDAVEFIVASLSYPKRFHRIFRFPCLWNEQTDVKRVIKRALKRNYIYIYFISYLYAFLDYVMF